MDLNIVGIGASAGGLAVLKELVKSLPKESKVAYIIVQHLDPDHDSMLAELLGKESTLPIVVAKDQLIIKANTVYVIPPNKYLEVDGEKLKLIAPTEVRGMRRAIDHLFRSLAENYQRKAIGIILSGAGNDGTAGARVIKATGGFTIAQNPESAAHSSMPESAIKSGVIDKVLEASEIANAVINYIQHPYLNDSKNNNELELEDSLNAIGSILESREDFDIKQYKANTIQRRIARRMGLTGSNKYKQYLQLVREDDQERKMLIKDLLINVTDFFRDQDAFSKIEADVIPKIINRTTAGEEIRIWIAGCATGEEVYSLAILFMEALSAKDLDRKIRIFATDIDEEAIATARKGIYSESVVAEVPENFLNKYFYKANTINYKIIREIRDMVSFAIQNVANDPPFSQMHLISCRNLLIYFKKEVQNDVLNSFHFALKPDGYMLLGSAESIGIKSSKFNVISKKWRIYKKLNVDSEPIIYNKKLSLRSKLQAGVDSKAKKNNSQLTRGETLRRDILGTVLPPTIVVDSNSEIIYNHGDLSPFTIVPEGEPQNDLFKSLKPKLTSRIRSAIFKAKKTDKPVSFSYTYKGTEGEKQIRIEAKLLRNKFSSVDQGVCITFYEENNTASSSSNEHSNFDEDKAIEQIELELRETKEELQNTVEELETSTEELKASHEEALSTNEELQSANEELEASTEELRSLNEELRTVNEQLKEKIDQMKSLNDDLTNFFSSTNIPTVFLDSSLKIQRYTPASEMLLGIGQMDIERPIHAVKMELLNNNLMAEAKSVLFNLKAIKKDVQSEDGRWFIREISPYKTEDRRIEGVVITFQEITKIKELSQSANRREKQQATIAKLGMLALSNISIQNFLNTLVREVAYTLNVKYCKVLKYQPEKNNLLMIAGVGWRKGLVGNATVPDQQSSQAGFTLIQKTPVIVKDLRSEQRFSGPDLLIEHDVISGMSITINHSDPPYGVLGIHSRTYQEFDQDDANFLQSISNLISIATKEYDAHTALKESENKLRIAKNSANIGSFEYYLKHEKTIWDKSIKDIWGFGKHEEVTQEKFWAGIHPEDSEKVKNAIEEAIQVKNNGQYASIYRVINKKSNDIRWVQSNGKIQFEQNEPVKMIGMVQEITKMKNNELSLQNANEELKEINLRKNEFLATLGHELRNPLAAISGAIELIPTEHEEYQQIFNMLNRNVERMRLMLDDLLDLSRISKGNVRLEPELINIKKFLEHIVFENQLKFKSKNQELSLHNFNKQVLVNGDLNRLEQVVNNLLTNAYKFTPEGGKISIFTELRNNKVRICVKDNGIGISEISQDIFEPFSQITPSKGNQGLGIGLALVKKFVEMHDGTIEAESEGLGKGCTFIITLNVAEANLDFDDNKVDKIIQSDSIDNDLDILIVDDNEDAALLLKLKLEKNEKCKVSIKYNGEEALKVVGMIKPKVIILDIGLPDMDGYELLRKMKKVYTEQAIYIAHTGYGHSEAKKSAQEAGFDYHLTKPLKFESLLNILNKVK